ncbi:hypothetical protein JCM8547_000481 [Rhodosporidiobolus lusitaniae]
MASKLPAELWERVVDLVADDYDLFELFPEGAPARPRFAALVPLSLVCWRLYKAVATRIVEHVAVTNEKQLRLAAAFFETNPHLAGRVSSLEIYWNSRVELGKRRLGAKKWRAATLRFSRACTRLRKVSIVGPSYEVLHVAADKHIKPGKFMIDQIRDMPYFDVSWLEEARDTLEELYISRLRFTSFAEVAHIRLPALSTVSIVADPPAFGPEDPVVQTLFWAHFCGLKRVHFAGSTSFASNSFLRHAPPSILSSVTHLTLPLTWFQTALAHHGSTPFRSALSSLSSLTIYESRPYLGHPSYLATTSSRTSRRPLLPAHLADVKTAHSPHDWARDFLEFALDFARECKKEPNYYGM